MKKEMQDAWDKAMREPGQKVSVGDMVVCDSCSADCTDSSASGGIIFQSKAICPTCAPKWVGDAVRYNEMFLIRAECPIGQSFADFVRAYRGPDAYIRVTVG